jgi:replicative DNA helicase
MTMTESIASSRPKVFEGFIPPQALDAERAVLAAMMLGNETVGRAVELIEYPVFYRTAHQKIFQAITALYERNERADLVTVGEELRKRGDLEQVGGLAAVSGILEFATTSANLEEHIRIIEEKSVLRRLITAANQIQQESFAASDEVANILDQAERLIFEISDTRVRKGFKSLKEMISPAFDYIQKLSERKVRVTGVPSGFPDLDEMTAGFQKSDLIVIAGRPAMGKSSFAINIAENAAIQFKVPAAIFSLEMSADQLVLRMLCSQSKVALHRVRSGHLSREDWPNLTTGAGKLHEAPIMIDDSASPTVFEIRAKCRRLKAENKLGIVVIDYLQLIRAGTRAENRVQEISHITRSLKALAKELDVPILALSQLSRAVEQRHGTDKRPQLSDLRESGSVEQDADLVLFVFREEYYKRDDPTLAGRAKIIIGKQRNGPTGDVDLTFLREFTRFEAHADAPAFVEGASPF